METLAREKEITFFGEKKTVHFPTIGEYINIERLKQILSRGSYAVMAFSGMDSATKALDLIDAIAYFSVLLRTDFEKKVGVISYEDVLNKPMDENSAELIRCYKEEFAPFYNAIEKRKDRPAEKTAPAKTE